jgi:CMP/dCMP kinase
MNTYTSSIRPPDFAITIDGPSGGGKWTLASGLAKMYNLLQIDNGIFYRVLALRVLSMLSRSSTGAEITELDIQTTVQSLLDQNQYNQVIIQYEDCTGSPLGSPLVYSWSFENGFDEVGSKWLTIRDKTLTIRSPEVNAMIARVTSREEVRLFVNSQVRTLASSKRIVIDGRATGTTVFPEAQVKLWVTADVLTRAKRQVALQASRGKCLSIDEVIQSIEERDRLDVTRTLSPVQRPNWSYEIDTSDKTPEEVLEIAKQIVDGRIPRT